jgi:predicted metal-binding protein
MTFDGAAQLHLLYVCRTCPRYEALPRQGEKTRGMALVEAVRALAADWAFAHRYQIIGAHCLNGWPRTVDQCDATPAATARELHGSATR